MKKMKKMKMYKIIVPILVAILILPVAFAQEMDAVLSSGNSITIPNEISENTPDLEVNRVEPENARCRINIFGSEQWLKIYEETHIENLLFKLEEINAVKECRIKIKRIDQQKTDLYVLRAESNKEYLKNGEVVELTFHVKNDGSSTVRNVEWVFYNNGYPTGTGATQKYASIISEIAPYDTAEVEIKVPFYYYEDTVYKSGTFITTIIVDPNNRIQEVSESNNYYGLTIYVEKPQEEEDEPTFEGDYAVCGDGICNIKLEESYINCPQDCEYRVPRPRPPAFESCYVFDVFEEGESMVYSIAGENIRVELLSIDEDRYNFLANFRINGETIGKMMEGNGYKSKDAIMWIEDFQGDDEVAFCLNPTHFPPNEAQPITSIPAQPDEPSPGGRAVSIYERPNLRDFILPKSCETCKKEYEVCLERITPEPLARDCFQYCPDSGVRVECGMSCPSIASPASPSDLEMVGVLEEIEIHEDIEHDAPNSCVISPGLACTGVSATTETVTLTVTNGFGADVKDLTLKTISCLKSGYLDLLKDGKTSVIKLTNCNNDYPKAIGSVTELVNEELEVTFNLENQYMKKIGRIIVYSTPTSNNRLEICKKNYEVCLNRCRQGSENKICDNGCFVNSEFNRCVPYGTRLTEKGSPMFCDLNGALNLQKPAGEPAQNSYECESNFASSGNCIDVQEQIGTLQRIFRFFARLFGE